MKLKRMCLSFPLLLSGVGLSACQTSLSMPAAVAPISVHGNIQTFEIAPVLLAAERHYSGEATVRMGGIPNLVGAAAIPGYGSQGTADVATHAETQALRYSVQHPDLRIILTVSEGLYRIVGRRSSGISKLSDLRGKRVAAIPPTSSGYFLHRMLDTVGLSAADVKIVPISPLSDMPKALKEGRVDAIAIWEPMSQDAADAIGADAIEFGGKGVYRELFGLNSTATKLADPQTRVRIVAFVRSVIQASDELRRDPARAKGLLVRYGGHSADQVERAWKHQAYPAMLVADLLDVLVEEEKWLAASDGRQPRTRDELSKLIDPTILQEAMRS
jgi:NitT/TauT family transport system substrate-binding protein